MIEGFEKFAGSESLVDVDNGKSLGDFEPFCGVYDPPLDSLSTSHVLG